MTTRFKEPRSTDFVDLDGWILNDTSGKNFQVDKSTYLEALESVSCKLKLFNT